jgi:hypothetical protein
MISSIQALAARQPMFTAHSIVKVHFLNENFHPSHSPLPAFLLPHL